MLEDLAWTETGYQLPGCVQGQNVLLVMTSANETTHSEMESELKSVSKVLLARF